MAQDGEGFDVVSPTTKKQRRNNSIAQAAATTTTTAQDGEGDDNDILTLNVGGTIVSVRRGVLTQEEGSVLAAKFSGRWDHSDVDKNGNIFVDVSVDVFQPLLDKLRMRYYHSGSESTKLDRQEFNNTLQFRRCMTLLQSYGLQEAFYPYTIDIPGYIGRGNGQRESECFPCFATLGSDKEPQVDIGEEAPTDCFFFLKMPLLPSWTIASFHVDSLDDPEGEEGDHVPEAFLKRVQFMSGEQRNYWGGPDNWVEMTVNWLERHEGKHWKVDVANSTISILGEDGSIVFVDTLKSSEIGSYGTTYAFVGKGRFRVSGVHAIFTPPSE